MSLPLEEARNAYPPMLVIYDHPLDFPQYIVVRRWYGDVLDPWKYGFAKDLQGARRLACDFGGSIPLMRSPDDDESIVETWI
jgi:hypothetical protein